VEAIINFIFCVNFIMGKTEITWIELINEHIKTRKAAGKPAGVRDVIGDAKSDWTQIKEGKHPKYSKGTSKGRKTKKSGRKHSKKTKKKHSKSMKALIGKCKLCAKCSKEIKRIIKKLEGGGGDEE
jgi:hypothetical protein